MKKIIALSILFACSWFTSLAQTPAQEINHEELAVSISQDQDFKLYTEGNMRYLELFNSGGMPEEEKQLFNRQQKRLVENINSSFPALEQLPEREKHRVLRKASRITQADIEEERFLDPKH